MPAGHPDELRAGCAPRHLDGGLGERGLILVTDKDKRRTLYARSVAPGPIEPGTQRGTAVVAVMNDFYWCLFGESRATPYPAEAIGRVLAKDKNT
jgi:hypothetical protein